MRQSLLFSKSVRARQYVRFYLQRTLCLGSSSFVQPVMARALPLLDFEFGSAVEIQQVNEEVIRTAEPAALVGILTHNRAQLLLHGNAESFVIVLTPVALYQLF